MTISTGSPRIKGYSSIELQSKSRNSRLPTANGNGSPGAAKARSGVRPPLALRSPRDWNFAFERRGKELRGDRRDGGLKMLCVPNVYGTRCDLSG